MDGASAAPRTSATRAPDFKTEAEAWMQAAKGQGLMANVMGRIKGASSNPTVATAMARLKTAQETARSEIPTGMVKALQARAPSIPLDDIQKIGARFLDGKRPVDQGTILKIVRAIDQQQRDAPVESAVRDRLGAQTAISPLLNSAQYMHLTKVFASLVSKSLPSGAGKLDSAALDRWVDREFELGDSSLGWAAEAGNVLALLSAEDRAEAITHATNRLEAFTPTLRADGTRAGGSISAAQAWSELLLRESLAQFVYTCASKATWADGARDKAQSQLDDCVVRVRGAEPGGRPPSTAEEVRTAVKLIASDASSAEASTSSLSQDS